MVSGARVTHRVTQFFATLLAPFLPVAMPYAAAHLTPTLLALFRRMSRAEQRHGIALCRRLEAQGWRDPDLLAAALLHDAGKIQAPPRLWERVFVVLAEHFLPERAAAWRSGAARWQRPFAARRYHAEWGANLAAEAGASPRAVALIRRHHDAPGGATPGADEALPALQAADEQ